MPGAITDSPNLSLLYVRTMPVGCSYTILADQVYLPRTNRQAHAVCTLMLSLCLPFALYYSVLQSDVHASQY